MITSDQVQLRIEGDQCGALVILGDLDLSTAPRLAAALDGRIASGQRDVVLDLGGLEFCDSSGLSMFVNTHRDLQAEGRRLILRNPSPQVRKLLATVRLDQELEIA